MNDFNFYALSIIPYKNSQHLLVLISRTENGARSLIDLMRNNSWSVNFDISDNLGCVVEIYFPNKDITINITTRDTLISYPKLQLVKNRTIGYITVGYSLDGKKLSLNHSDVLPLFQEFLN